MRYINNIFSDPRSYIAEITAAASAIILVSAYPYFGLIESIFWFTILISLVLIGSYTRKRLNGRILRCASISIEVLIGAVLSFIGVRLMILYDGPAQILGMATIGLVVWIKLVVETLGRTRFWLNITPPLLAASYFQIWSATQHARQNMTGPMVTDLANLVFLLFTLVLIRSAVSARRRRWLKTHQEISLSAQKAREAHKIAVLAEELAGSGHFRLGVQEETATFSRGIDEIYGFNLREGEASAQDILDLYGEGPRARLMQLIAGSIRDRRPGQVELRCRLRDGRERIVLTQVSPELNSSGEVSAILGVSMDVTEARSREAALAESEARLRLLADHVTDVVLWVSAGGRILYASPSVERLGHNSEAMVGQALADYIPPADHGAALLLLNQVFENEADSSDLRAEFRFVNRRTGAEEVWMEGFARAVRDPAGTPRSTVLNFRDVTRRRELEEDLRQAKIRAEAAANAKGEFLANMSHEVRTPLTGVIGFSTLLSQTPDLPAQAETLVRRVLASGEALLTVVNDILEFSKLEAGQLELTPAPFPIRDFLDDVVGLFSAQAESKGLQLEVKVDPGAPLHLLADRARLRQVLINLLGNAIKFTDQGWIRVAASYDENRSELRVSVTDTGVGISSDSLDRLFQRFTQADGSISRRYGGTGLGLSICRQLTELMGGGIGVVSTPGAGSSFTFTIRAPTVSHAEIAATPPAQATLAGGTFRILLVDDLEVNRELVRALLGAAGDAGMKVDEAASGPEAISMAVSTTYDLILMDLQMPGMDGFAASRAIRRLSAENATTPIIALSANVLAEHIEEAEQAGMSDHVDKPIVPARLFAVLNRWAGVRVASPSGTTSTAALP